MFLDQSELVGEIPFSDTLPSTPESIDITKMTEEPIHAKIKNGYESYKADRTQNAAVAFENFREIINNRINDTFWIKSDEGGKDYDNDGTSYN